MDDHFEPEELLFRSVKPEGIYWKASGELTSAAFKDSHGLSVDRGGDRPSEDAAEFLYCRIPGVIVHITVEACIECSAITKYDPQPDDYWHSLILRSEETPQLTASQARHLAQCATIERM